MKTKTDPDSTWQGNVRAANEALSTLEASIAELTKYRDNATAEISKYLRVDSLKGIELDPDAIRATLTRPYTLFPINENEAWLIHWRGVKMPIFGWVVGSWMVKVAIKSTRKRSTDSAH